MSRRLRKTALVLVLAAAWNAPGGAPARAARGMEIAIQDDSVFLHRNFNQAKAYDLVRQLVVTRMRVNVSWAWAVQGPGRKKLPKPVIYNWGRLDRLVSAARAHGIRLQLTLTTPAPAWATANHRIGPYKPNAKLYGDFVRAAATHFKSSVQRYSIMNEPNYVGWLAPLASAPGLYRALYTKGYAAIKSVDPSAQVLIGETSPYALRRRAIAPLAFLKAVLRAGPLRADGYAHHPYDFRHPVTYRYPGADNATLATLGRLTSLLTTLGRQHRLQTPGGSPLDVYVTEWGYMSPNAKYGMDDRKRARYIAKGYQMALANPRVREMLQFLLIDPGRQYRFFDMSIVSRKGKVSNTYSALKKWAQNKARICQIATPSPC